MKDYWYERIKKLSLSYATGWEYRPGEEEAGSVFADVFLVLMAENRKRYERLWEKHRAEFLQAVPGETTETGWQKCGISIAAPKECSAMLLPEGTEAFTVSEQGQLLQFVTKEDIRLEAAGLLFAIYEKNGVSWLVHKGQEPKGHESKGHASMEIPLFKEAGERLYKPFYEWSFSNLCNGLLSLCFTVSFEQKEAVEQLLWTVSDGTDTYCLHFSQQDGEIQLLGDTPAFAKNLQETSYMVRVTACGTEGFSAEQKKLFSAGFSLEERQTERKPQIVLTQEGGSREESFMPFGREPEEGLCLYLACDGVFAGESNSITVSFDEVYIQEERLPPKHPADYEKALKKYPWLAVPETVYEWKTAETVWEYFDGSVWCVIQDSHTWEAACKKKEVHWEHRFTRPSHMCACVVDGKEHFFIRCRILKADNAYALYYRKYIPVWKRVRLSADFPKRVFAGTDVGEEHAGERMYFGFDAPLFEDSSFLLQMKEEASGRILQHRYFPGKEPIRGEGEYYGLRAWWLVWEKKTEEQLTLLKLWHNYVEVLQAADRDKVSAGAIFSVRAVGQEVLQSRYTVGTRYESGGMPYPDTADNRADFFRHFGRLLTADDICCFCRERYPFLKTLFCYMESGDKLVLELCEKEAGGRQEILSEIEEGLKTALFYRGNLWLQRCMVSVRWKEKRERLHAGQNHVG